MTLVAKGVTLPVPFVGVTGLAPLGISGVNLRER